MIFINLFFMMFSLISIEINNFYIVGLDKIINLFLDVKTKDYLNLLNYINFKIIIRMRLFDKITLIKITLKSEIIKKIIKIVVAKDSSKVELKNKLKNKSEGNSIIDKRSKKRVKKSFKKILIKLFGKMFKIAEIKLICSMGLCRADITAIITGFFNCLISLMIANYFIKDDKNRIEIESKSVKYYINPIYSEKVEVKLCFLAGISSKMY